MRIKAKRFVAMLDIMGFKSIIEKKPHKDIYSLFCELHEEINQQKEFSHNIESFIFSDTIVIISHDKSDNSITDFIFSVSFFIRRIILNSYAVNGAISYGTVTMDLEKNIFFGQPIVDAHLLQEDLLFYGVALHHSAEAQFKMNHNPYKDAIIPLMIPTRSIGWQRFNCINWSELYTSTKMPYQNQIPIIRSIIEKYYQMYSNNGRAVFYIQNTEKVLKQWYDFTIERARTTGWGTLMDENYITKCPND